MDPQWADEIKEKENVLFIIEGLVMYLTENEVGDILNIIDENFKSCTVLMEIMPPVAVKNNQQKSVDETNSRFIWGVKKGDELKRLNPHFRWIRDVNFFDGLNVYKPVFRLISWIPFARNRMDYIAVLKK